MNLTQLSKNIIKPKFINTIKISKIDCQCLKLPLKSNEFSLFYKMNLVSRNLNLNNVNIFELLKWIELFDYIKVVHWDDDKEFDFSNIENILLVIEFDFKNYLMNEGQTNYCNLLQNEIKIINELDSFDYYSDFFKDMFLNYILKKNIFEKNNIF